MLTKIFKEIKKTGVEIVTQIIIGFPTETYDDVNETIKFVENLDYIFSSHCLEHLYNWVDVLDYWTSKLKSGGVLFLYLPDYSQEYWRPWNNRKHKHVLNSEMIIDVLKLNNMIKIHSSGCDINHSFVIMAEKG